MLHHRFRLIAEEHAVAAIASDHVLAGPTLTYQAIALNGEVLDPFTKQKDAPEPTKVSASGKPVMLWGQIKRVQ